MPDAAIELHDSVVTDIRRDGSDVVIELDAYVHVSEGTPVSIPAPAGASGPG